MKKSIFLLLLLALATVMPASAQNATDVLDKAAKAVSDKRGIEASFTLRGGEMNDQGTLAIKGKMFRITMPDVTIWFDGKTQWTYLRKNDEVNISAPTAAQQQAINPYNFIYLYKRGYTSSLVQQGNNYIVTLKATGKKRLQELILTISKRDYSLSQVRMHHDKGWNTVDIRSLSHKAFDDAHFRFNAKDYPSAEVIDLR